MTLRPLDAAGRSAYLREIRPRFLAVRIASGRVRIGWWLPTWALEEPIRLLLRLAPIAVALAPAVAQRVLASSPFGSAPGERRNWWQATDELFSERYRDLLSLPDGVPLLDVTSGQARIVIEEVRP